MKKCLLLVDLQNDYFPGGRMELDNIERAAANAGQLLRHFRDLKRPIIHIQHIAMHPDATFFLPDTPGAEIHPSVMPLEGEPVITKHYPNSFRGTELQKVLQQTHIDTLFICGAMSHMCIDATTRAAFDLGFSCFVAEDACATRELSYKERCIPSGDVHASFMAALSAAYAGVSTTAEIIAC